MASLYTRAADGARSHDFASLHGHLVVSRFSDEATSGNTRDYLAEGRRKRPTSR
jgi:hypothetical protein